MAPSTAPNGTPPQAGGLTVSHMLGEITWLLTQSPTHKHFTFADMEWMILPPLMLEQYRVFRMDPAQGGDTQTDQTASRTQSQQPIGYATWASLSDAAEAKLLATADTGARLRPDEWKSGPTLWLVDLVIPRATAENKLAEACLADLLQGPLKGQQVKFHRTDPQTGVRNVVELGK